ncbi:MAG: hypothetical protein NT159_13845 [Proteobacteria bacterium]|nr:hypothetical protein [Pseudomonadota bacterium]
MKQLPLLPIILALLSPPTQAGDDPVVNESVITAAFADRSITALVTHFEQHRPFKRAIILMPGHPGIMKIQSAVSYELKGNFLVRSRKMWLDPETIVFSVDAPSDEWRGFTGNFRAGARYAEDIRGLVVEIVKKYAPLSMVVVGTSEGSVSAYYAARALGQANLKVIFTSSLFNSSRNSPGLAGLEFDEIKIPMLWVHHETDPCPWTPYWQAQRHAGKTHSPLITVKSNNQGQGDPCKAFSQHGYIGVEAETVLAMKNWIVSGEAKDVVAP